MAFKQQHDQALAAGVHPLVVGYLSLHSDTPVGPRAWQRVSDVIKQDPDADLEQVLTPIIGGLDATRLAEFSKVSRALPDMQAVLDGRVTSADLSDVTTAHAVSCTLAVMLKDEHDAWAKDRSKETLRVYKDAQGNDIPEVVQWRKRANNALVFVMNTMSPEMGVLFVRTVVQVFKLPYHLTDTPALAEFATKYRNIMMAS